MSELQAPPPLDRIEDQLIGINDQLSVMNELLERLILHLEAKD